MYVQVPTRSTTHPGQVQIYRNWDPSYKIYTFSLDSVMIDDTGLN